MFLKTRGACAVVASVLLAGAVLISSNARAADLPVPLKPVARPESQPAPEGRKQLLEEFRQFLKERVQPH